MSALKDAFTAYKNEHPNARLYDVAAALNVSELALVAAECGMTATRLRPQFVELLKELKGLGTVMALTRNPYAVIEKLGEYEDVQSFGKMGLVLNQGVDLRLFFAAWTHAYAVKAPGPRGELRSIQFFDAHGVALHKVYVKQEERIGDYEALVARFANDERGAPEILAPVTLTPSPGLPAGFAPDALRRDWEALKDTHDFVKLLKQHEVTREQAFVAAGPDFARPVAPTVVRATLDAAREQNCSIMVFIGNHGIIEIHTGPIRSLKPMGPWLNVLDPGFNLHLREDQVARVWLVRKPTTDGIVTSLELFAEDGYFIGQIFGERKPGRPELERWREIVHAQTQAAPVASAR
jgi:putative hemin transport protein